MKKLMGMMLAACMVAGFSLAQVTSLNVVGYNTVTLLKGYNMLACNFDALSGATNTIDAVIPGTTRGLVAGNLPTVADDVMVFNPVTQAYATYFLWYTTKASLQANNYKWVLNSGTLASVALKSGDAFWYNSRSLTNISIVATMAGQVPTTNKNITIDVGYNMIAGNYAADWDPNTLGTNFWKTIGAVSGNLPTVADDIMVFNPNTQVYTTEALAKPLVARASRP